MRVGLVVRPVLVLMVLLTMIVTGCRGRVGLTGAQLERVVLACARGINVVERLLVRVLAYQNKKYVIPKNLKMFRLFNLYYYSFLLSIVGFCCYNRWNMALFCSFILPNYKESLCLAADTGMLYRGTLGSLFLSLLFIILIIFWNNNAFSLSILAFFVSYKKSFFTLLYCGSLVA